MARKKNEEVLAGAPEVQAAPEAKPVEVKRTGKFYALCGDNGKFALVGPDGRILSPFDMDEEKAKDMARRMQK